MNSLRESGYVSVRHGQERDQLDEADSKLHGLDWRSVYAAAVRSAGALCVGDLLAGFGKTRRAEKGVPQALKADPLTAATARMLVPFPIQDATARRKPAEKWPHFWGHISRGQDLEGFKIGYGSSRSARRSGTSGIGE